MLFHATAAERQMLQICKTSNGDGQLLEPVIPVFDREALQRRQLSYLEIKESRTLLNLKDFQTCCVCDDRAS